MEITMGKNNKTDAYRGKKGNIKVKLALFV